MSKKNFSELAELLVKSIGSAENVSFVAHCATRLRFQIKDKGLVDEKTIKSAGGVVDAQWSGNQYQVIIGPDVADVYNEVCKAGNFDKQEAIKENLDAPKEKLTVGKVAANVVGAIADCFIPLIPAMCACGLLKVVMLFGNMAGLLPAESSTYQVLNWVGDTAFYFMPIFVGATAAKRFGASLGLGLLAGALLLHPTFVANVSNKVPMSIFGIPMQLVAYKSTLLPAVMSVYVLSHIEKFFNKHFPSALKGFLSPLCTMLIMLPLEMCLIAPIGNLLGVYVAAALVFIYEKLGFVAVGIMGVLFPLLVMTGMQKSMIPYLAQSFATFGYEGFMLPASYISNLNQAIAGFAVGLKSKNPDTRSIALSTGFTATFGPTEPVMYGVNLKFKTPFYCALVGNGIGAAIAGLGHCASYVMGGGGGILIISTFFPGGTANVVWLVIASVVGAVVTFVLTFIFFKDTDGALE